MHPEAAFLTGYALVLVVVAAGLGSLGRRSTHPWASKMLAASKPSAERPADAKADWPHSEVPVFHLGLSGVALAAATLLTAVNIVRHHDPIEILAQFALLVIIGVRLISVHRALAAPRRYMTTHTGSNGHSDGEPPRRR